MITFAPLQSTHLPMLHHWLNHGETFRWYGRKISTEAEVREKYFARIVADSKTRAFIVGKGQEPIGYIQRYKIADYPEYERLVSGQPGDFGLDLFIGQDDLLGRGFGTEIVTAALPALVFSRPDAARCLIGPEPANRRAIRCYEKCGFRHIRTVTTPDGEEYLMARERPPAV